MKQKINGQKNGEDELYAHMATVKVEECVYVLNPSSFAVYYASKKDPNGRFIICEIETEDKQHYTLCNVYGPNKDSATFYDSVHQNLLDLCSNIIMMGDFNLVLNTKLDRYKSSTNNEHALQALHQIMSDLFLVDIWRIRNPDTIRYSWRREASNQASRLDYALISQGISTKCEYVTYMQGILSDHSAVLVVVTDIRSERGAGYWKLNTSILDKDDVNEVIVANLKKDIAATQNMDPIQRWETIKKTSDSCAQELIKKMCRRKISLYLPVVRSMCAI